MRIAGLIAVSALVAACSQSVGGQAESSDTPVPAPPATTSSAPPTPQNPSAAPAAGASIDDVVDWIEAGAPADPTGFHVAFRDGVTTRLAGDIAFVAPSGVPHGTTQCMTDPRFADGALSCLVDLTSPPPRPPQGEGMWTPGWVEFSGTSLTVGSLRGDPGPFVKGSGPELAAGQSLTFGDTRCRSDVAGLFCVNYAHRSAVRLAADGVLPFGCLAETTAPPGSTQRFSC